ncbi:ABC transporter ATP-binding protein [Agilicoccus flavus]|uniref:ABC transporter ATP-binding protein n=1 Tax=Agilicoccus flavus TaxID=2775968 RepID=UPI001CF6A149|nr:dipeptide ABC transporter ATP-binding protein [Agilicoccus flavus]
MADTATDPILVAKDLVKHYPIKGGVLRRTVGHVKAVDGVSFELRRGETLGIVGESGCGKSTLGRLLMRLEEPTSGTVDFDGVDLFSKSGSEMRRLRRDIQIVFQDPYTSLNPRKTVGDIVGEPFEIHPDVVPRRGRRQAVEELLELVGLSPEHINRYPHQFSGGQRQRIGIARGIALKPKVLICDEPVSALDVSVQAQVVNLMGRLQKEMGLAYVFIAHDLSVVRHISDRVGVMYLGKMAEFGTEDEIYERPTHPYTQALLSAVPVPDPTLRGHREQIMLKGDVPSPANPPSGCRFHTRCWKATEICTTDVPELVDRPDGLGAHRSACHHAQVRQVIETVDVSGDAATTRLERIEAHVAGEKAPGDGLLDKVAGGLATAAHEVRESAGSLKERLTAESSDDDTTLDPASPEAQEAFRRHRDDPTG